MLSSYIFRSIKGVPQFAIPRRNGTSIKVVLLTDLENKGTKGQEILVKRGFARNYLIPRKIAVYSAKLKAKTPENLAESS